MELQEACIFTQIVKALKAARDRDEVLKMLPTNYRLTGSTLDKSTAEIVFWLQSRMTMAALKPLVCKALVSCNEDDIAKLLIPEPDMSFVTKKHKLGFANKRVTECVLGDLTAAKLQHLGMVLCIMSVIGRREINQRASEIIDTLERCKPSTWSTDIYNALHASDQEYSAEALCIREDTERISDPILPMAEIKRKRVKDAVFDTLNNITDETLATVMYNCVSMGGITEAQHGHITSANYLRDAFVNALEETTAGTFDSMSFTLENCLARAGMGHLGEKLSDSIFDILWRS